METKICKLCGEEKPLQKFKLNIRKDGSVGSTKKCSNCSAKQSYWRKKNGLKKTRDYTERYNPNLCRKNLVFSELRVCNTCGKEKPIASFTHKRKNGNPSYTLNCHTCIRMKANRKKGVQPRNLPFFCETLNCLVRKCCRCGIKVPLTELAKGKVVGEKTYRSSNCSQCRTAYLKEWAQKNKERICERKKQRVAFLSIAERKEYKKKAGTTVG